MSGDYCVFTQSVYMCLFLWKAGKMICRLITIYKKKIKKSQAFSRRQERSHFFSSPLAENLASSISISLLPTQLLKLQHVLGLFHFISNGLAFSVTEAKKISEKINPLKMGFHQGYTVWCCVKFKNNGTQWHWCKAPRNPELQWQEFQTSSVCPTSVTH